MKSDNHVVFTDIRKKFGGTQAVDSVSGQLSSGTIYGLIGPNGSGKTTLINLISGFYAVDDGSIRLGGDELTQLKPHQLPRIGLVRTFQQPKSFGSLTVLENVLLPAAADGRKETFKSMLDQAHEALELTGLQHMTHHHASSLSGGQTMLLQLARSMMFAPIRLLLLDEPFGGVAPALKLRIMETIRHINARFHATVLLVSHEMPTIKDLCSSVIVMSSGSWIAQGTLEEISSLPEVVAAYLGKPV